jgi:hypothetical protein
VQQVDTSTATLSQVVDRRRTVELPLSGRNAASLALITACTVLAPASADEGSTKTFPVAVAISANGSRQNQAAFRLDGANNNHIYTNVNQPFLFPDAVQEFSVQTSNYSVRYGGNTGVVNIVTKSGENQFHGDVFELVRHSVLNAPDFWPPIPIRSNAISSAAFSAGRSRFPACITKRRVALFSPAAYAAGTVSKVLPNAPRGLLFPGDPGAPQYGLLAYYKNFSPRGGFAYDLTGELSSAAASVCSTTPSKTVSTTTISWMSLLSVPQVNLTAAKGSFSNPYLGIVNPFPAPHPPPASTPFPAPVQVMTCNTANEGVYKTPLSMDYNLALERHLIDDFRDNWWDLSDPTSLPGTPHAPAQFLPEPERAASQREWQRVQTDALRAAHYLCRETTLCAGASRRSARTRSFAPRRANHALCQWRAYHDISQASLRPATHEISPTPVAAASPYWY